MVNNITITVYVGSCSHNYSCFTPDITSTSKAESHVHTLAMNYVSKMSIPTMCFQNYFFQFLYQTTFTMYTVYFSFVNQMEPLYSIRFDSIRSMFYSTMSSMYHVLSCVIIIIIIININITFTIRLAFKEIFEFIKFY